MHKNFDLPGCLHIMHALESGEELPGLTLSIIRPLGKLGIVGKELKIGLLITFVSDLWPEFVVGGGDIRSCLLLTDWRVCGGEIGDIRNALRLRFCKKEKI